MGTKGLFGAEDLLQEGTRDAPALQGAHEPRRHQLGIRGWFLTYTGLRLWDSIPKGVDGTRSPPNLKVDSEQLLVQ